MPIFAITALAKRGIYIGYPDDKPKNKINALQISVPEKADAKGAVALGLVNSVSYVYDNDHILMLEHQGKLKLPAGKMEVADFTASLTGPSLEKFQSESLELINKSPDSEDHASLQTKLNALAEAHELENHMTRIENHKKVKQDSKQLIQASVLSNGKFAPHNRQPLTGLLPAGAYYAARRELEEETGVKLGKIKGFHIDREVCQNWVSQNVEGLSKVSTVEGNKNYRTLHFAFYVPGLVEMLPQLREIMSARGAEEGMPTLCSWSSIHQTLKVTNSEKGFFTLMSQDKIELRAGSDLVMLSCLSNASIRKEYIKLTTKAEQKAPPTSLSINLQAAKPSAAGVDGPLSAASDPASKSDAQDNPAQSVFK